MKKTLFITMLTAALLGGNAFANTNFEGGKIDSFNDVYADENGNLRIFEDPGSPYEIVHGAYGVRGEGTVDKKIVVAIEGGTVQMVYGARLRDGDARNIMVKVTGGIVPDVVGAYIDRGSCTADCNTVIVAGGKIGFIHGGWSEDTNVPTGADCNKIYITNLADGCAPNVYGGYANMGAYGNEVHLVGAGASILIDGETYQGHAMTLGYIYCGLAVESYNNSIDIYGSGIRAYTLQYLQRLNFHLVDGLAAAEAPMLTLSSSETVHALNMATFSLGIIADDVTDLGLLTGRTVTLAETQVAIAGFGEGPYKVVNVSKGGQSDAAKALITLGNEGKDLLMTVLSSSTELLAPGASRQAGSATITALSQTEPGLLDNLTLDTDTIRGQGQAASMASGLKIDSTADLLMEGLTLAANNRISVGAHTVTLRDVAITGGWTVAAGSRLNLRENSTITGGVTVEGGAALDLGGGVLSCDISLGLDSVIGNGSVNGDVTFAEGDQKVSLCGDLGGTGDISIGVVNQKHPPYTFYTSSLNLGGHTLTKGLKLIGDTTVSNGRLVLAHNMTWSEYDLQERTVSIGKDTTVDLNSHTFSYDLAIESDTAIGNGTIGGNVTVNEGKSVRFFGDTYINSDCTVGEGLVSYHGKIEAGDMTIQALHRPIIQPLKGTQGEQAVSVSPQPIIGPVYPGLMKELTVSENEIIGTGRASSLADGLEIQSESDLLIKGMTITADNKISVGENTITLNDVTIKLSQTSYELVSGVYYFNLSDLFHCSVDMTDVTFDASDLTLPEGFNPETNAISFNLGDAKLTAETAERDIYLLLGGYGSRTMSIDEQGRPVFTALVPTPEPTTGTLSLMALAGLCARRRRK